MTNAEQIKLFTNSSAPDDVDLFFKVTLLQVLTGEIPKIRECATKAAAQIQLITYAVLIIFSIPTLKFISFALSTSSSRVFVLLFVIK